MKPILLSLVLGLMLTACGGSSSEAPTPEGPLDTADVVYTNGKIYTVNETQPWAEAVAIKDGRLIAVGSVAEIAAVTSDTTEVNDLGGKFVMPGFTDTHLHAPLVYVHEEAGKLLVNATTADQVKEALLAYAEANPGDGWIRMDKWTFGAFPGAKTDRYWIDAFLPDRPVIMYDESGHNVVVNSRALEIAGITKDTPSPFDGSIEKDPDTGEPTGYLGESAIALVGRHVPRATVDDIKRGIERVHAEVRGLGITSYVDMTVTKDILEAYRLIENDGKLTFRISAAVAMNEYSDELTSEEEARAVANAPADYSTDLLRVDSYKFYADGTPTTWTSEFVEPYSNRDTHGSTRMGEDQLALARELHSQGLIGRFHTLGDGTVRQVLNLIEELREAYPEQTKPFHIGHNFMVHPDDVARYEELNVIAEFSPVVWFPNPMVDVLTDIAGEERVARITPVAELHRAGATVTLASDWPAGTPTADPFRGLEAAVTRKDPYHHTPGQVGEPVSVEDAIRMYTINATKAMMLEDEIGSIEVGKYADIIVLDQNLLEIEPSAISDTNVVQTIFNGEVVYDVSRDAVPSTRQSSVLIPLSDFALAHLGHCAQQAMALRAANL